VAVFLGIEIAIAEQDTGETCAMLRLTVKSRTPERTVVAVDGWVAGEDVAFLERQATGWLRQSRSLVLELDGVQSIDRAGRVLLRGWVEEKAVVLAGGSPFVRMLFDGVPGSKGNSPRDDG